MCAEKRNMEVERTRLVEEKTHLENEMSRLGEEKNTLVKEKERLDEELVTRDGVIAGTTLRRVTLDLSSIQGAIKNK